MPEEQPVISTAPFALGGVICGLTCSWSQFDRAQKTRRLAEPGSVTASLREDVNLLRSGRGQFLHLLGSSIDRIACGSGSAVNGGSRISSSAFCGSSGITSSAFYGSGGITRSAFDGSGRISCGFRDHFGGSGFSSRRSRCLCGGRCGRRCGFFLAATASHEARSQQCSRQDGSYTLHEITLLRLERTGRA
jgi:hypothetical protein